MNAVTWLYNSALVVRIAAALLLTTARPAAANQPPEQEWFATELAAVVAATSRFNPVSIREDREFMGVILHDGECYSYTVGAGERGRDQITVRITVDDDVDVIAFWHTHGAKYAGNRYFSDVDTRLVEKWQRPLYLADYTGALKVIAPGVRTFSSLRARGSSDYRRGSVMPPGVRSPMPAVNGQEFRPANKCPHRRSQSSLIQKVPRQQEPFRPLRDFRV